MWKDVFQKNITLRQRMGYLFGPPGWSHDGSRLTSEELRAKEKQNEEIINTQYATTNVQSLNMKIEY